MFEVPVPIAQPSFSRGEVSPEMFGRVDIQGYAAGLRTLLNAFVRAEGGVSNRSGTQAVAHCTTNTAYGSVLMPFIFNVGQAYAIEMGAGAGLVTFNGAVVAGPTVAITALVYFFDSHPNGYRLQVTTGAPHGLAAGAAITVAGVIGTGGYAINGTWTVYRIIDANNFSINTGMQGLGGSYTSGGTVASQAQFATPYTIGELTQLRYSQSADTVTVVHPNHKPYELKRVSANSFTFLPAVYTNGPFLPQNTDGTTFVFADNTTGPVTLTSNAPIFNPNHVGALFQLVQQDLSQIPPWEANKLLTTGTTTPVGLRCRSNLKNYLCVAPQTVPGPTGCATGAFQPIHTTGTQTDGNGQKIVGLAEICGVSWQFTDPGFGNVLITQYVDSTHVKGVVQPYVAGQQALLPTAVVGGATPVVGPFTFSGTGSTPSFSPLTGISTTDPTKFFVTVGGIYQNPSTYTILLTGGGTIVFNNSPPAGTNNISVEQIGGLNQTSYWSFGAFSADQGYPSAVTYFPDRLVLAATPKEPVGVFASQTSQYHNFAVSNPVVASDAFTIFLNARQLNSISDLIPLKDILIGTANIMWRLWSGPTGTAISPLAIAADPQNFYGTAPPAAVLYGESAIFAQWGGRKIRDLIYQFQFDKYVGQELTLFSRHLLPVNATAIKLAYAPEPFGQLFVLRGDGVLLACTYLREQNVIGWSRYTTAGTFEDAITIPENNGWATYVIVNRTIAGTQTRTIERFAPRELAAGNNVDWWFLDCATKYDGRNTTATTMTLTGGTTWAPGDTGTLTASGGGSIFTSTDPTNLNEIWLYDPSGTLSRVLITGYTSATVVSVRFKDPVPADLQATATAVWSFARTTFGGAGAIAGATANALVDGNVVLGLTVGLDGSVTLPNAGSVVLVGLPYNADFEGLHLNIPGQETIRPKAKSVPALFVDVTETRGFLSGTDFNNLTPHKERAYEPYLSSVNLQEGILSNRLRPEFDSECHWCIRQDKPLPITLRMVIPTINVGDLAG